MSDDPNSEKQPAEVIDLTLMKEIQELIDSGSSENKQKALDIIERDETRLSGIYAMNFFGSLNFDSDEVIKKRAREIMDKKIGPDASKNLDESIKKFRAIQKSFKHLASDANQTSAAFDASHNLARVVRDSLTLPINAITLSPVYKMAAMHQKMVESLAIRTPILPNFSPILESAALVSRLSDVVDPKLTIPQAFGKSIPEIRKEMEVVIESDEDLVFNYDGYKILYNLERFLRDLIKQRIIEKDPKSVQNRIPQTILDDWKVRKTEEEKSTFVSGDYDLIDYSDFNDLKMIFDKGRNMQLFLDICNEAEFRGIISKLNELDPIRKKIAHSRPLKKEEFDRLKLYAEDIDRALNNTSI